MRNTYLYGIVMVWHGMAWHGMAWHGMVWYGMVLYGIAWYCMACHVMYLAARCLYARINTSGFLKSWGKVALHEVSLATAAR